MSNMDSNALLEHQETNTMIGGDSVLAIIKRWNKTCKTNFKQNPNLVSPHRIFVWYSLQHWQGVGRRHKLGAGPFVLF